MASSSVFVIAGWPDCEWADRVAAAVHRLDALAPRFKDAATVAVVLSAESGTMGPVSVGLAATDARLAQITTALRGSMPVVPVLVGGGYLTTELLPEAIRDLAFREGLQLRNEAAVPVVAARLVATARTAELHGASSSASSPADRSGVFISYRRDDSALWAEELAKELALLIRPEEVFFDVGTIVPGVDFRDRIRHAIERSSVFVLVMGRGFLERDATGQRRIDRSDDVVRFEIRTALDHDEAQRAQLLERKEAAADGPLTSVRGRFLSTHVVLLGGAEMPNAEQLPKDIAALAEWGQTDGGHLPAAADDLIDLLAVSGRMDLKSGIPGKLPWSAKEPTVLHTYEVEEHKRAVRSETALARLAELGWKEKPRRKHGVVRLVHPQFPKHRFLLQTHPEPQLTLEQQAVQRAWAPKKVFSLSCHRRDAYTSSLDDGLVEAAVNPERFLERFDPRVKVDLSDIFTLRGHGKPGPAVIEAHQRTRRRATAAGGVPQLQHERTLSRGTQAPANALAFVPSGDLMVATDRALDILDLKTWSATSTCRSRRGWKAMDVSPHGWVALGSRRGDLAVLDGNLSRRLELRARDLRRKAAGFSGPLTTISLSSTNELVAAAIGRTIYVVQISSGEVHLLPFPERRGGPREDLQARFITRTRDLLVADGTTRLAIIDALSGNERAALTTGRPEEQPSSGLLLDIESTAISPRGDLVAFAGSQGQIALARSQGLEVTDLHVWSDPTTHPLMKVCAVAFSPDGRRLATVVHDFRDHQLIVGDLATSTPIGAAMLPGPESLPFVSPCVAWSPDAACVGAVSFSGTVKVWST